MDIKLSTFSPHKSYISPPLKCHTTFPLKGTEGPRNCQTILVVLSYVILSGKYIGDVRPLREVIQRDEGPTRQGRPEYKSYIRVGQNVIRMLLGTDGCLNNGSGDIARQGVIRGATKKVPRGDLRSFEYYTCITYLVIDYGIEPLLSQKKSSVNTLFR